MITSHRPALTRSWRPLLLGLGALVAWDVLVTIADSERPHWFDYGEFPFALFGSAIALFIGFAVNAAYNRWWEARSLWGQVVNSSRSLARQVLAQLDDRSLAHEVVRTQVAYVHSLRTSLRGQPLAPEAVEHLPGPALARVEAATNRPTTVLVGVEDVLSRAVAQGSLSQLSRLQLSSTLAALTDAQGGLERIRNTPPPVHYRRLPGLFARAFCVVLPFAVVHQLGWVTPIGSGLVSLMFLLAVKVSHDLAEPFTDGVHDIPMTALCRTIEVDLLEMLGEQSPDPLQPVDDVLW